MANEDGYWINPYTGVHELRPPRGERYVEPPEPPKPSKEERAAARKAEREAKKAARAPKEKPKKDAKPAKGAKGAQTPPAKADAKPTPKAKANQGPKIGAEKVTAKGNHLPVTSSMTIEQVAEEMDGLRASYAALTNRDTPNGKAMQARYRALSLAFNNLAPKGAIAPKLWEDIAHAPLPTSGDASPLPAGEGEAVSQREVGEV